MNRTARYLAIILLLALGMGAPGVQAQTPAAANQSAVSTAQSPSTAEVPRLIKFSGTLLDAQDRPMAGPVGVTFALYSQQTGGAALWLETQNVKPEASGVYTILLGANSANGVPAELFASAEARWLAVQVERQAEQPRVLLVSVPYALKAVDAQTLGGKPASAFVTTETLTGTGNSAGGSATPSSSTAATALPSSKAQSTPKKAASTPQPAVACTSVTSDGTGTANSVTKFTAACNIQNSAITETGGNVGIGTAAPAVALDVLGNNAGLRLSGTGTHQVTVTGATSGRLGQDSSGFFFASDTNGKTVRFLTNNGTLNEWMRITSAGNIGIGTATPAAKLDINGNQNIVGNLTAFGGTFQGLGGGVLGHDTASSGNTVGVEGIADSAGGAGVVGNSTAATGQAAGVRGFAASTGGAGVFGKAPSATGVTAGIRGVASSPSGRGVSGDMVAATANTAITGGSGVAGTYGYNQDGSPNGSATGGFGVFGQNIASASSGTPQGVRGETTTASGFAIGVAGFTASSGGIAVDGLANSATGGTTGVRGIVSSNGGQGVLGQATATAGSTTGVQGSVASDSGQGVLGVATSTSGFTLGLHAIVNSPNSTAGFFENLGPTLGGFLLLGKVLGTTNEFTVDTNGRVWAKGSYNCALASGCFNAGISADVAERIDVCEQLGPGDVVEINPNSSGHFRKVEEAYSTMVAGIVSTAPGVTLGNNDLEHNDTGVRTDERPLLALVGRVPVKVTDESGPIRPGDLLTSSSTPGYAMRCTNRPACAGAIVGKALEPLKGGTGVIQVLVTLQ